MSNLEKYTTAFIESFGVKREQLGGYKYQDAGWDSIGHMVLMSALENYFDIFFDTDDIIAFSSFEIGKEILHKYDVEL